MEVAIDLELEIRGRLRRRGSARQRRQGSGCGCYIRFLGLHLPVTLSNNSLKDNIQDAIDRLFTYAFW